MSPSPLSPSSPPIHLRLKIPPHPPNTRCGNERISLRSGVAEPPPSTESSLLVNTGSKFKRTSKEPAVKLVGLLPHFRLTKRKRDHRVGSSRTRMSDLFRDEREGEEMYRAGVSTDLELYSDPWKIKKKLTESDLGHLSRLLIPQGCVRTHVFPQMGEEMVRRIKSRDGMEVTVRDADTGYEHRLMLRYWASSRSYVLNKGWNKRFVKWRGLKVGDEIGMLWDPVSLKFHFKVLSRVD